MVSILLTMSAIVGAINIIRLYNRNTTLINLENK